MENSLLYKLLAVTLLIVVYVLAAAFDMARETVAPLVVIAIAVVLFFPTRKKK
ncbi:hypothetical protein SFC07_01465 [Corynebacterium callunae]|uniref:hypothetical protein n=1 Tax=Corynebacterium callunae TaxID=1721 RepID=UPI003982651F